jgi:hypothetical protein
MVAITFSRSIAKLRFLNHPCQPFLMHPVCDEPQQAPTNYKIPAINLERTGNAFWRAAHGLPKSQVFVNSLVLPLPDAP